MNKNVISEKYVSFGSTILTHTEAHPYSFLHPLAIARTAVVISMSSVYVKIVIFGALSFLLSGHGLPLHAL